MAVSPFSSNRVLSIFAIAWIFWVLMHAATLFWLGFTIEIAAVDAVVSCTLLLLASLVVSNTLRFYTPGKESYINIVAWCLLLTLIAVFISRFSLLYLYSEDKIYVRVVEKSLIIRACVGFLLVTGTAVLSILWYTLQDQKENERRKTEAERLAREAELYNLRQQLQPHFLFNSLNSISALIGRRPEEARKMIYQLSDFLRGTLRKEENEFVTLEDELNHLQLYLDIERVRFGHRLATEIIKEDSCDSLKLPAMLLQPIVENAIKFGLYDTIGEVSITVNARCVQNYLELRIQNPYDPASTLPKSGTGFGLTGIKRRLYLLFARTDLIETRGENNIFTTIVRIPQQ